METQRAAAEAVPSSSTAADGVEGIVRLQEHLMSGAITQETYDKRLAELKEMIQLVEGVAINSSCPSTAREVVSVEEHAGAVTASSPPSLARADKQALLSSLDSILCQYKPSARDPVEELREEYLSAVADRQLEPLQAAMMGCQLYNKTELQVFLTHCELHKVPNELEMYNLKVAREIEQREQSPRKGFVDNNFEAIAQLDYPLWPSDPEFDDRNNALLGCEPSSPPVAERDSGLHPKESNEEEEFVPSAILKLLKRSSDMYCEGASRIAAFAGESVRNRDLCLEQGMLQRLFSVSNGWPLPSAATLHHVKAISSLCGGKPQPASELIDPSVDEIVRMLNGEDEQIVACGASVIADLSNGGNCPNKLRAHLSNRVVGFLCESRCLPRMIELLLADPPAVVMPAIRTIGNVVEGYLADIKDVLQGGALHFLCPLMNHSDHQIQCEACRVVLNIAAKGQLGAVVAAHPLPRLLKMMNSSHDDVKKASVALIGYIARRGSREDVKKIGASSAMPHLCEFLADSDDATVAASLGTLLTILGTRDDEEYVTEGMTKGMSPVIQRRLWLRRNEHRFRKLTGHSNVKISESATAGVAYYIDTFIKPNPPLVVPKARLSMEQLQQNCDAGVEALDSEWMPEEGTEPKDDVSRWITTNRRIRPEDFPR